MKPVCRYMYENTSHLLDFSQGLPGCLHGASWTFKQGAEPIEDWEVACQSAAGVGLLSFAPAGSLPCVDWNQTLDITTTDGSLSCNTSLLVHRTKPIGEWLGGLVWWAVGEQRTCLVVLRVVSLGGGAPCILSSNDAGCMGMRQCNGCPHTAAAAAAAAIAAAVLPCSCWIWLCLLLCVVAVVQSVWMSCPSASTSWVARCSTWTLATSRCPA